MIIQDCTSYPGAVSVAGIPASTATLDVTAQRRAKGYSYLSSRATWDGSDPFTIAATSFWSSTMSCGNKFWVTALGGSGRVLATASFGR